MTVYVDDAIHLWRGKLWCHLFSDNLDELHQFAAHLGLQRSWFQEPPRASWCHYDITANKRRIAIGLGATEASFWKTLEVAHGKKAAKKMRRRHYARVRSMRASHGD